MSFGVRVRVERPLRQWFMLVRRSCCDGLNDLRSTGLPKPNGRLLGSFGCSDKVPPDVMLYGRKVAKA